MSQSSPAITPFVHLRGHTASLVLDLRNAEASALYWGAPLAIDADLHELADLAQRPTGPGSPSREPRIALTPLTANGFVGPVGLSGHRNGASWAPLLRLTAIERSGEFAVRLIARDDACMLRLTHSLSLDAASGVLRAQATLVNEGLEEYWLEHLAAPVISLPHWASEIIGYSGGWANEFQTFRQSLGPGAYLRENRRGRSSHDAPPMVIVTGVGCSEERGDAVAFHLGASGNHRVRVERLADGRSLAEMSELLLPGEIRLRSGQSYTTPELYSAVTSTGLVDMSARLHCFVRTQILPVSVAKRARPVHYNTWEAIYFDHKPEVLVDLATRAAALGVERFVLDDGWFGGRRNERAGLGDWIVSKDVYPAGLTPLIEHVRTMGMEFGLWVEPEMVNPDSDLFRAHPEWVLRAPDVPQIDARHQLVLDLTRPEVIEHLYARLHALLSEHAIGYLKWDMNRDVNHPGDARGAAAASAQARAVHALIDRLRTRHPQVEIESCASGGGRANYEILKRTHRIWTSDNNDACDRLRIQLGFSYFFPPEVTGAHVGPRDCHVTGRRISMKMRAGVAIFGHMGVELDLRELNEDECRVLKRAIALHKDHRSLLHRGRWIRLDTQASLCAFGCVADDRSEALFACASLECYTPFPPGPCRFAALDPHRRYLVTCIWPEEGEVGRFGGEALMRRGLELPLLRPQSILLFHFVSV